MAGFYMNAKSLYEEFQKKELLYLNSERNLNSTLMWKKDLNLPLQEYLQRISEREKRTEEAYQNIMKQMEELNQHTDALSFKLEKLGILQNGLSSLTVSHEPFSSRPDLQIYGFTPTLSTEPVRHFQAADLDNIKLSNLKSVSTQTENNNYCDKCLSLMPSHSSPIKNLVSPSNNTLYEKKSELPFTYLSVSQTNTEYLLSDNHSGYEFDVSRHAEMHTTQVNEAKNFIEQNTESASMHDEQRIPSKLGEQPKSPENKLGSNNASDNRNAQAASENKETEDNSQFPVNKSYESKSTDSEINVEVSVSKSDEESINHEFDFLDSDMPSKSSKFSAQADSNNYATSPGEINPNSAVHSTEIHDKSFLKQKKDINVSHANSKLEVQDNKSETSASASGPPSPNISVGSDSDSYGKGSSLNASAAYQALLGNTFIPPKIKKNEPESESEDEVESALASAVQRPQIKPKSSAQPKEDKSSSQSTDLAPAAKGSKPSFAKKPQAKLSKSTKKVLGLDSSSGSEVELAVKPPKINVDEDDDEFFFE